MVKKIICIVPARSGSKRIKNKNIIKFKSTTLIDFICKKIQSSKLINHFFIATDKKKIFDSIKNKKKFLFYKRSKNSATDRSKTEKVILELLKKTKTTCNIIILVQLTNPFLNYKILDNAIKKFLKGKYDSMLSVTATNKFLWHKQKITKPINYDYKNRKMTQNLKEYLIENGSFYIFNYKSFLKSKNRLHGKIGYYLMPKASQFEIDDHDDLKIIKRLIK